MSGAIHLEARKKLEASDKIGYVAVLAPHRVTVVICGFAASAVVVLCAGVFLCDPANALAG